MSIDKNIDGITLEDIENLITNEVCECRNLEYKLELPDSGDKKRELLYDISAMANAGGGDIIFGIREDSGKPIAIEGIQTQNADSIILSFENSIRDCISPRIIGLAVRSLKVSEGQYIFMFRIPRTLNFPHMVTMGGTQRFFTRNSAGKYPMDVTEIRAAFLTGTSFIEQAKSWRMDRLNRLLLNKGATPIEGGAKIVLHLIPLSSMDIQSYLDVKILKDQTSNLWPFYTTGMDYRYNLDGFLTFALWPGSVLPHGYVQFFRTGQIESVDIGLLKPLEDNRKFIASIKYEEDVINHTRKYLNAMKSVGIQPPIVIELALLGVRDYYMGVGQRFARFGTPDLIKEDDLVLPGVLIENWDADLGKLLRPIFDTVWNSCGWSGSLNYDEAGNWRPHSE
ncbi:hypothetical protein UNSWDHB_4 [Dehalobacter sp. UNSWDHB]|jgi:Predicted transcriptional regulator containing an HTH domain and an uncharacterized domain shared with the mammalian protein Schlafen|uniref:AlbA family DNA-binding domain-containing protein n=1 Tax=unclassified Dehalobacter TaxID=2635733 RepID=UPI00028A9B7D|nr:MULTISPECIES: ATP-binding protein [unclassified Dehalobacter]AFV02726.1 putative transcriptional regulator containing an HTH domain and an uncharacterized domain shared with the mammalian protein Schlafen [Dehalobacter sp. DCA]AFV05711.1 putative transcriptional regulator containing an HTH domain and an uncharacterized domain shared with the mammalian protein Schlafen [Dehalobacter sp. CF]EQB22660.1 hypothetical protein UNSWDHB_4 [Dehalobacter sp. UNSWDHB]